jgi:hypothetical protein
MGDFRRWKLGLYVYPEAVVAQPDYAKRLAEEAGVDHFILRSGYGLEIPAALGDAVQIVRDLKTDVCLMTGTFWGNAQIEVLHDLPYKSFESQFVMNLPGSDIDAALAAKMGKLCAQYSPDAICLTHARYRHPAHIRGIFEDGAKDPAYLARMKAAGIPRAEVDQARIIAEETLRKSDKKSLQRMADKGLIGFLDDLSQTDAWSRYFEFRTTTVSDSYRSFQNEVKSHAGVAFGTNAYSPNANDVCGHDYDAFDGICDFVQPLLAYMESHRLQPIAAWAVFVK